MAFAVRLYSFSKKKNSTAIPGSSVSYSQVNCVNKGTLDILHPEIILKYSEGAEHNISTLVNTNYAYIPAFERWYYVRSWNNDGRQWTVSMDVDALASCMYVTPFNAHGEYWNDYYKEVWRTRFDMTEKDVLLLLD